MRHTPFIVSDIAAIVPVVSRLQTKVFQNRIWHGIVYKTAGESRYQFGATTLIARPDYLVYLPRGSNYVVDTLQPGSCIAVNFATVSDPGLGPFSVAARSAPQTGALFEKALRQWRQNAGEISHAILCTLYEILMHVEASLEPVYMPSGHIDRLRPLLEWLRQNQGDPALHISQLARRAGMSPSHFRQVFSAAMGMPPVQYLAALRMARAKELLLRTDDAVGEIAALCGFADVYYFSRAFRRHTGLSPTEYRRQAGGL